MAQLAPSPKFSATYIDADGNVAPAVGYKLYTYTAGTSTPKDTYTTYGLGTANTNPVILDARGEASVWLDGNYKFILKTDADVTVWTVDEIRDQTSGQTFTGTIFAGSLTVSSTAVTWSGNPTHSGNHTFTNNVVVNGNTTLGDSSADALTVNATTTFASPVAAPAFTGNPTGTITSGTYTPTLVNGTNCAASAARVCHYARVGNTVMVWGSVEIDPTTAAGAQVTLTLDLPIASNLASYTDLAGAGAQSSFTSTGNLAARIYGDAGSNKATFEYNAFGTAAAEWAFSFAYRVL